MGKWFVLFVRTGSEEGVVEYLQSKLASEKFHPFVLTKEVLFWNKGRTSLDKKLLFPGYVMVHTNCGATEALSGLQPIIANSSGRIYKVLSYGNDKENIILHESEQALWEGLVDLDFCVRASEGSLAGDKLTVTSGPLVGKEASIKAVNKYRQKAFLNVKLAGELLKISLVLRLTTPVWS